MIFRPSSTREPAGQPGWTCSVPIPSGAEQKQLASSEVVGNMILLKQECSVVYYHLQRRLLSRPSTATLSPSSLFLTSPSCEDRATWICS